MKIRLGFVSNSSSMSSIIFPKNGDVIIDPNDKVYSKGVHVEVVDEEYNRGRNELLSSVADKIRFFISMLAITWDPDYKGDDKQVENLNIFFEKMEQAKKTIYKLAKKHGAQIWIATPTIDSYVYYKDEKYDHELKRWISESGIGVRRYFVNISTENVIFSKVAALLDDEPKLEKFLFDRRSFAIVGGDEYYFPMVAEYIKKKEIDFDYERIADDPDCEEGEYWYTDEKGVKHYHEYTSHWGEYMFKSCLDENGNLLPKINLNCTEEEIKDILKKVHNVDDVWDLEDY